MERCEIEYEEKVDNNRNLKRQNKENASLNTILQITNSTWKTKEG